MQQISATSHARGFTLLEVMLVMAILGMLAVTVSLALPDSSQQRLESDARRLKAQIGLAVEQAIYRNRDYGLLVGDDSYRFYQYQNTRWVPLEADSRLAAYALNDKTVLQLRMAGQPVDTDRRRTEPQIFIASDGQVSEFELTLRHPDAQWPQVIRANFAGDLQLVKSEQP
ncbi:GspH/FimT family protein [Azotobacter armeniacus]